MLRLGVLGILLATCKIASCVEVKTDAGTFIGASDEYGGVTVDKFLGVPYAEPPVGSLRFAPPQPRKPTEGTVDATWFGNVCMQAEWILHALAFDNKPLMEKISEDCLNLNVYVPGGVQKAKMKAVMVYFYGGAHSMGGSLMYDLRPLATSGDVVAVSVNSRVGLFGFFSTGDDYAPGNYGLFDQHLALNWVHENIEAFGGDPGRVTIFGESSGSGSSTAQSLSPLNKGLFHRVIAQSGTIFAPWSFCNYTRKVSLEYAEAVGCDFDSSKELLECLRAVPASELQEKSPVWPDSEIVVPLSPVTDGKFFPVSPWHIATGHHKEAYEWFKSLDLLIGVADDEGSPLLALNMGKYAQTHGFNLRDGLLRPHFRELLRRLGPEYDSDLIESAAWWMYAKSQDRMSIREAEEFFGDAAFFADVVTYARFHADKDEALSTQGNTFFYQYVHMQSKAAYGDRPAKYEERDPWLWGAAHCDEITFLYGKPATPEAKGQVPKEEIELSKALITYWTNFAKSGYPHIPNDDVPAAWPRYTREKEEFLQFNTKNGTLDFNVRSRVREKYISFWTDVLWKIMKKERDLLGKTFPSDSFKAEDDLSNAADTRNQKDEL